MLTKFESTYYKQPAARSHTVFPQPSTIMATPQSAVRPALGGFERRQWIPQAIVEYVTLLYSNTEITLT